jgi:hypothetical protein
MFAHNIPTETWSHLIIHTRKTYSKLESICTDYIRYFQGHKIKLYSHIQKIVQPDYITKYSNISWFFVSLIVLQYYIYRSVCVLCVYWFHNKS